MFFDLFWLMMVNGFCWSVGAGSLNHWRWPRRSMLIHTLKKRSLPWPVRWGRSDMAVCQNLVPLVNIKIAGKWMFIPLKMVLIGIDPYPYFTQWFMAIDWWPIRHFPRDFLRIWGKSQTSGRHSAAIRSSARNHIRGIESELHHLSHECVWAGDAGAGWWLNHLSSILVSYSHRGLSSISCNLILDISYHFHYMGSQPCLMKPVANHHSFPLHNNCITINRPCWDESTLPSIPSPRFSLLYPRYS